MSNGRANWYNDLQMVRERLNGRAADLKSLATAFRKVGNETVAEELELTEQVLKECSGSVMRSIETVTNKLGQLALEKQEAKETKK